MDARPVWRAPDNFGVTIPVLLSLVEQYSERRQRELMEDATAGALAAHDPGNIKSLGKDHGSDAPPDPTSEFEQAPWAR